METKCFEIRDDGTFMPVICIRPTPDNEEQRWLLRRDGYRGDSSESCIIYIKPQCRGVNYDPYDWNDRTNHTAHKYIQENWASLQDGSVIDVSFILGESAVPKKSEKHSTIGA